MRVQEGLPRHDNGGSLVTRGCVVELLPTVRAKAEVAFATSARDGGDGGAALGLISYTTGGHLHWHLDVLVTLGARMKKRIVVCHLRMR